jgi:chorismate mutase/prephenate dehydratase
VSLDDLRAKIDALDAKVLELLNERARMAMEIGKIKHSNNAAVYVPEREKAVYEKLLALNQGPLPEAAVKSIYREIISCIRALEKPTTVAFLGPRHTFSELAAHRVFGATAEFHPMPTLSDVFTEVERGRIDYGVVPVESSMGGGVSDTLDRFVTSDLKIINEVLIHVTQNLLSKSPLDAIKRVYSKDQAFYQCRVWLHANLPHAEHVEVSSTSEAARIAANEEGAAAIAGALAAEAYDVVAERIEDAPHNFTRFFVIGRQSARPTGKDKTSLLISLRHRAGALQALLVPISKAGINMTKIESRPSRKKAWEYVFFIDLIGHVEDEPVKKILDEIAEHCIELKVLGSYPQGDVER